MSRSVATEQENLRRQRLRIERDPVQHRGERKLALVSADDDDAAGNTVELIRSQSLVLDGSKISHGHSPFGLGATSCRRGMGMRFFDLAVCDPSHGARIGPA